MQIVKIYMVKPLNLTPYLAVYHEILLYTCYCHAFSTIKWTRNVLEEEGSQTYLVYTAPFNTASDNRSLQYLFGYYCIHFVSTHSTIKASTRFIEIGGQLDLPCLFLQNSAPSLATQIPTLVQYCVFYAYYDKSSN